MLGLSDEPELSEQLWQALPSRAKLPTHILDSQHREAADAAKVDCQRQYTRKPLHSLAIAIDGDTRHACHTKDISRIGLGFYAPVNFFPKRTLRLWLPNGQIFLVRVTRCRRLAEHCYEVGTRFHGVETNT